MNLSELFIRRPVTTVLLNAAIVLAGVIAWGRIPVAALPSYNTPVINVFAALPTLTPTVSWEAAAQADPQLIAGARVDDQTAPEGRWAELTAVDAVRHRRYALLPPELLGRMGPRFVDGAQLLCEAIDRAR